MTGTLGVYIETYGCQMNEYDSELVKSICQQNGYRLAGTEEDADVILLNTCAVRERAHMRVFGRLQQLRRLKQPGNKRDVTIGVLGCMAQNLEEDVLLGHDHVDFIAGPDNYRGIPGFIEAARGRGETTVALERSRTETYSGVDPVRGGGVNAWLAIMRGCNNMCTFCVVPNARGRERSRDSQGILGEVEALAADGYKQVTLLGQNVNSYESGGVGFADLLRRVADVPGVERVRFTAPHPKDFPRDLIRAIAEHPNICKHIHLPLQAGNDRVLEAMRRTYTNGTFRELVGEIREAIPHVGLTTDVIVGFPTETDEEYEDTRSLMQDIRFDAAFIFKYSERKGTYAQRRLSDDVPPETKTKRIVELIEQQKIITNEINHALVGTVQEVLLEEHNKKDPGALTGRTDNFKTTLVQTGGRAGCLNPGDIVDVTVVESRGATLFGRPVSGAACVG